MRLYSVYFAQKEELIKIGCSSQPIIRCEQLKAKLLGTIDGAFYMEKKIHEKFVDFKKSGEWFFDCQEIRDFIDANCKSVNEVGVLERHEAALQREKQ